MVGLWISRDISHRDIPPRRSRMFHKTQVGGTQECANIAQPRSICLTHSDVYLDFSVVPTRIFLASDIGDKKVQTCKKAITVCVNISRTSKLDDEEEELNVVQTMGNH